MKLDISIEATPAELRDILQFAAFARSPKPFPGPFSGHDHSCDEVVQEVHHDT